MGFKFATTGDTLCDSSHPNARKMEFPDLLSMLPLSLGQQPIEKMGIALAKLAAEDQIGVRTDEESGQVMMEVWASYTLILLLIE